MRRVFAPVAVGAVAAMVLAAPVCAGMMIGSPDMPPSQVDAAGVMHEDWGHLGLRLVAPGGARVASQRYSVSPVPTVVTVVEAGPVALTMSAYRAPVWPAGVDVLTARMSNGSGAEAGVRLEVDGPDNLSIGDRFGSAGGRAVLCLPAIAGAQRTERDWGCTGEAIPMPGWGRPVGECDPAFRNIRAGMGGVSTRYRFRVEPGARRTAVLGFCESHWGQAWVRPLLVNVEGCKQVEIDPISAWGQHVPGCLRFDAVDVNQDGRLQISVDPHPRAQDRNTILNAIWVFKPESAVDVGEVLRGKMSGAAEYYVDVGGEKDQLIYERGLAYDLHLAPGASQELVFLVACPGASVPNPDESGWTPERLRKAAEDVWGDWFARGTRVSPPDEMWRAAPAQIVMSRTQANGYFAATSQPGELEHFSQADATQMIFALDYAGYHAEAERMLRVYWDKPVPPALALLAQGDDGRWQDAVKDPCAHGLVLQALARHALLSGDVAWAKRCWPAVKAGCEWMVKRGQQDLPAGKPRQVAAVGLLGAARIARVLGLHDASSLQTQARALDPAVQWPDYEEPRLPAR